MTVALVGTPGSILTSGSNATVDLPSGNSGDLAAFIGGNYPSGFDSVIGSVNGAYTKAVGYIDEDNNSAEIWYFPNASASTETLTITPTVPTDIYISGRACRFSGIATSSPLDQTGTSNGSTSVTASGANTQASELVLMLGVADVGSSSFGFTTPSGYTQLGVEQDSNSYTGFIAAYKVVSATETSSATGIGSAWSDNVIATFKAATGGGNSQALTATLADVTVAAAQTLGHPQSLAVTLADVTVAVAQEVTGSVSQALAVTMADVTVAVAQTLRHPQSLAVTLADVTVSIVQVSGGATGFVDLSASTLVRVTPVSTLAHTIQVSTLTDANAYSTLEAA